MKPQYNAETEVSLNTPVVFILGNWCYFNTLVFEGYNQVMIDRQWVHVSETHDR